MSLAVCIFGEFDKDLLPWGQLGFKERLPKRISVSAFSPIGSQSPGLLIKVLKKIFVFQNPRTLITRSVITGKPALKGVPLSRSKRQCFLKHFDKDLLPWGGSCGSGNGFQKVRVYKRFRSSASKKCECISVFAHRLPKSESV